MKMTKKLFKMAIIVSLLVNGALLNAQVTVGDNTPPNATLDVVLAPGSTTPAGVIAPRVDRLYLNNPPTAYGAAQIGAIVYVTTLNDAATGQTSNVTSIGYYYFDGSKWQAIGANRVPTLISNSTGNITLSAADMPEEITILICNTSASSPNVIVNLPSDLGAADTGKILYITADTGGAGVTPSTSLGNIGGGFPNLVGVAFIWYNSSWIRLTR